MSNAGTPDTPRVLVDHLLRHVRESIAKLQARKPILDRELNVITKRWLENPTDPEVLHMRSQVTRRTWELESNIETLQYMLNGEGGCSCCGPESLADALNLLVVKLEEASRSLVA